MSSDNVQRGTADVQPAASARHFKPLKDRVLTVLIDQSGLYARVIAHRTNTGISTVETALHDLIKQERVFRKKDETGGIYRYYLLEGCFDPTIPAQLKISPSVETLHRLVMIKRLRNKLIEEHWPILDAVIKDYEFTLQPGGEDE